MKFLFIIATIVFNTGFSWVLSKWVGWDFMETIFLGGLLIMFIVWIALLTSNRSNNRYNAQFRGTTGYHVGVIKPFEIGLNPFLIGTFIYLLGSGILSGVYYWSYFV